MTDANVDKTEFIRKLNEDLATEFRSIVQYVQHLSCLKGARFQQVATDMREHISQELEHAIVLADQIDFLGGVPECDVPAVSLTTEPEAALRKDLDLEERQLARYRNRIAEAAELGLPDVAEALSPLLTQTQDHVQDLRGALGTRG